MSFSVSDLLLLIRIESLHRPTLYRSWKQRVSSNSIFLSLFYLHPVQISTLPWQTAIVFICTEVYTCKRRISKGFESMIHFLLKPCGVFFISFIEAEEKDIHSARNLADCIFRSLSLCLYATICRMSMLTSLKITISQNEMLRKGNKVRL